jgi:hypothetical protein
MDHRKWKTWDCMNIVDEADVRIVPVAAVSEHNDLFDAWERALRYNSETLEENNRLDRELDEARKRIEELEAPPVINKVTGLPTGEYVPLRVPFSDEQIERMAAAARAAWAGGCCWEGMSDTVHRQWRSTIRAALAAGGLEPCPVPEYDPADVALRPGDDLRAMLDDAERKIHNQRMSLRELHEARERDAAKLAALRGITAAPTDADVEALARAMADSYLPGWYDNPICNHSFLDKCARAAFAHIGAPERPKGLPTAEEMHRAWMDSPDEISSLQWCRWALQYLAPYLREPVGCTLDVTPEELRRVFCERVAENQEGWPAVLEYVKSRIRPAFECKECAKLVAKIAKANEIDGRPIAAEFNAAKDKAFEAQQALNEAINEMGLGLRAALVARADIRAALEGE